MSDLMWRQQLCDLAKAVWADRMSSTGDVRSDISKAVGRKIPAEDADPVWSLSTDEVLKVLGRLNVDEDFVQRNSELCVECYAPVGACKPECGQYEDPDVDETTEVPRTEKAMEGALHEVIYSYLSDNFNRGWSVETFKEAEILTSNRGLVVKIKDVEYQITIVRS